MMMEKPQNPKARCGPRLRPWVLAVYVALCVHHQALGKGGVGCAGRTGEDAVRTLLFHQRWNVFSSAEDYVVWEIAPARLDDGSVIDIWRGTEDIAWAVPRGFDEPAYRRGRWRAWPYTASRDEVANIHFWSMLCDDFERRDSRGRSVLGFHFYMMQADAVPIEKVRETGGDEYGDVRKRLMQKWDCTAARDARAKGCAFERPRHTRQRQIDPCYSFRSDARGQGSGRRASGRYVRKHHVRVARQMTSPRHRWTVNWRREEAGI